MATKIRLQRHGRKGYAYYHIVVADSRAPRDGRFIERLGSFNPNTHPATIDLNFERSLYWIQTGAQPSDTVRTILSNEGVMLKKHLLGGVKKGAFDEATANEKFDSWKSEKEKQIEKQIEHIKSRKETELKKRIDVEIEKNKKKAAELAKKLAVAKLAEQEKAAGIEKAAKKAEAKTEVEIETAPVSDEIVENRGIIETEAEIEKEVAQTEKTEEKIETEVTPIENTQE